MCSLLSAVISLEPFSIQHMHTITFMFNFTPLLHSDLTLLNICDIASLICVKYMLHNDKIICCVCALVARNTYANHMLHIIHYSRIGLTDCQLYQKYIYATYNISSLCVNICYTCMQHIFLFSWAAYVHEKLVFRLLITKELHVGMIKGIWYGVGREEDITYQYSCLCTL